MQYLTNVVTLKLNQEACTGCGMCKVVCPHAVFELENGKARIDKLNQCMECGACAVNCKFGAIAVRSGVGCAAGILSGILNNAEPSCGCSVINEKSCC
jgi:NAD-dependent dihydropyrimidine dehydrogenase PreA subunit